MSRMKPLLHLVTLKDVPIFQQLQWEEALLRADARNWCLWNQGSPPAIVLGISGQVDQLIRQEKFRQAPLPLIRRFSGGGTVVVDQNTLFVTFVCQSTSIPISPFPAALMEWSANFYRPLFSTHPFQLRENDYVIGEHKWGGNAQSIVRGRWLHHSSLLWDYHPHYMEYLLIPSRAPMYRQGRLHEDFLCRLQQYWPSKDVFQAALVDQIKQHFTVVEESVEELDRIAKLPHRKATRILEI